MRETIMARLIGNPQDIEDVTHVFETWIKAIQHRKLDHVIAAHDSAVVMFDVAGDVRLRGIDAYRSAWDDFLQWFGDSGVFEPSELTVIAGEDVALTHCLVKCIGSTPSEVEKPIRLTIGYRKQGGAWSIIHEHHSVTWGED